MDKEISKGVSKEISKELSKEKEYLNKVRKWMENYCEVGKIELFKLEERTNMEFKKASGTYSQDYENVFFNKEVLRKRLSSFEESMEKPYFGRIDFRERKGIEDILYIGKHSIRDPEGDEDFVIDWRAPAADLYYSATLGKCEYRVPKGFIEGNLTLKRRFTYTKDEKSQIDRYFDEGDQIIIAQSDGEGKALDDEFLRLTLDEASSEKLKEIVATIASEQNEIIRSEKNIPIIVQGSAGAGKTTVALHRLSYLLYKHKDNLKDKDVCIVAPNNLFIDYISEVLPDLGSTGVIHATLEDIMLKELGISKYGDTKDEVLRSILESGEEGLIKGEVSRIKGSKAFLSVLEAMADKMEKEWGDFSSILLHDEILYSKEELRRLFFEDLKHLNIKERRDIMENWCKKNLKNRCDLVSEKIERNTDKKIRILKNLYQGDEITLRSKIIEIYENRDEILKKLKNEGAKKYKEVFKERDKKSIKDIYGRYITDEGFIKSELKKAKEEVSDEVLKGLTTFNINKISSDDLPPMMYLKILLSGTSNIYSHMVVDEAQDYSYLQLMILKNMVRQDSMTLVGDLAQGIYSYRAIKNWKEAEDLFKSGAVYKKLNQSYRSTVEIINRANVVLNIMDLDIDEAIPVLRHGRDPETISIKSKNEIPKVLDNILKIMEEEGRKTLALVTKTQKEADEIYKILKKTHKEFTLIDEKTKVGNLNKVVIPSYMTKGLEFDCVVLENENSFTDSKLDLRLKYVSLTRALHLEFILKRE